MRILLFTVVHCKACDAHRRELLDVALEYDLDINVYNIDDEKYLSMCLTAMRKYGLRKTPSIVLLDDSDNMILKLEGIQRTIQKLKAKLDETK